MLVQSMGCRGGPGGCMFKGWGVEGCRGVQVQRTGCRGVQRGACAKDGVQRGAGAKDEVQRGVSGLHVQRTGCRGGPGGCMFKGWGVEGCRCKGWGAEGCQGAACAKDGVQVDACAKDIVQRGAMWLQVQRTGCTEVPGGCMFKGWGVEECRGVQVQRMGCRWVQRGAGKGVPSHPPPSPGHGLPARDTDALPVAGGGLGGDPGAGADPHSVRPAGRTPPHPRSPRCLAPPRPPPCCRTRSRGAAGGGWGPSAVPGGGGVPGGALRVPQTRVEYDWKGLQRRAQTPGRG